jgi:LAO/AO transport system kinase
VVLVPESGDEVQFIKSGLMEIADVFVVNKADRDGADAFVSKLNKMLHQRATAIQVFKTNAGEGTGVGSLAEYLSSAIGQTDERKQVLLAEKAFKLISEKRMADFNKQKLLEEIRSKRGAGEFNLYRFVEDKVRNS